jgi:hypothetical protein
MKSSPYRSLVLVTAAACLIGVAGCKTTSLESTWKAPEVGSIEFSKVLVIGVSPVAAMRERLEDKIKSQITAIPAIASYELLPEIEDQVNPDKIAEVIAANDIDGIITLRMIGMNEEVTYHPGGYVPTYYSSFSAYYSPSYALAPYYGGMGGPYGGVYGGGMPVSYEYVEPSETRDVYTNIETNIYDATDGNLIWFGRTSTKNASQRQQTIEEVAEVVKAKLKEQQLIP